MSTQIIKEIKSQNHSVIISPTDGSHNAYLASQLYQETNVPMVVILKDTKKAPRFMDDLSFFLPEEKANIIYFPG